MWQAQKTRAVESQSVKQVGQTEAERQKDHIIYTYFL